MSTAPKVEISKNFYIEGHKQMITSIVSGCLKPKQEGESPLHFLATGGRDKKITVWSFNANAMNNKDILIPKITLTGHNHFVSDLQLNQSNEVLLSSSWDGSMRLWNLVSGTCKQTFFGAQNEISSCGISFDNRIIYSSGFDNQTTIWNTQGQIKALTKDDQHTDVISRMRVAQIPDQAYYVTVSWDGCVKVWNKFCVCQSSFKAHDGPIYALDINKNGQYFVTGGKDGKVKLWKYSDLKSPVRVWEFNQEINDLKIAPQEQWIAVATNSNVYIIDIQAQAKEDSIIATISNTIVNEVEKADSKDKDKLERTYKTMSLCWDEKSSYLFAGCDNGFLKIIEVLKKTL